MPQEDRNFAHTASAYVRTSALRRRSRLCHGAGALAPCPMWQDVCVIALRQT